MTQFLIAILFYIVFCFISGAAGKKNRQKERRLMKGFNLASSGTGAVGANRGNVTPGSTGINPLFIIRANKIN